MAQCQQEFESDASKYFDDADADNNGVLSRFELCKICKKCGCDADTETMSSWFDDCDFDGDDKVTKEEFLRALSKLDPKQIDKATMRKSFEALDVDNTGCITLEDMKEVMKERGMDPENATLGCMDVDSDGKVTYQEFLNAFYG